MSRPPQFGWGGGWYGLGATKTVIDPDEARRKAVDPWSVVGLIITGILLYAGGGWLLGGWLGFRDVFVAGGALLGAALAIYLVYARLGAPRPEPETRQQDR